MGAYWADVEIEGGHFREGYDIEVVTGRKRRHHLIFWGFYNIFSVFRMVKMKRVFKDFCQKTS